MHLNNNYIDAFKYFLNTFGNTFLYYFQNIVIIHLFHYKLLIIFFVCSHIYIYSLLYQCVAHAQIWMGTDDLLK